MSQRRVRGLRSPLRRPNDSNQNVPVIASLPVPDASNAGSTATVTTTTAARRRGRPPRTSRAVGTLGQNDSRNPGSSNSIREALPQQASVIATAPPISTLDLGALGPESIVKQETVEIKTELDSDTHSNGESTSECAVCLQQYVHPVKLPCSHVFCFLCVKGFALHGCAICRRSIPEDFMEKPCLVDASQLEKPVVFDEGYLWFYEGRNGWWQYDERTSVELENAFKCSQRTCDLLIAGYLYTVDFNAMLQYRRGDPARRRRIKRDFCSIPKKGVAGIRVARETTNAGNTDAPVIAANLLVATGTGSDALLSPAPTPHAPSNTPQTPQTPPSPPSPPPQLQPRFQRLHEAIEETRRWSEREARCLRRAIEEIERMRLQDGVEEVTTPSAPVEACLDDTTFYNLDSEPEEYEHPWTSSEEEV